MYRARDARLNRDVAVKVSAQQFSERFEREARVIASLNHPNICQLFDVGPNFLVMELIEGPTLAERLESGAIPLEETLNIARQIADALEAAHEKGITHRDLKPGNIKIKPDGTVKVLDFGLAKLGGTPTAQSGDSPTLTIGQTEVGMILGTAAYMSPEQAKGKPVDPRSDIYAFGLVLYEMATGRRLHEGESTTEVLASVIKEEPQWSGVPPQIDRLLRRCLAKDPQKRLKHIGDVMALVEGQHAAAPEPAPVPLKAEPAGRKWVWPGLLALSVLALAPLNLVHLREHPPTPETMRFQIPAPAKSAFGIYLTLSPDGKKLAFTATGADSSARIWVRDLSTLEARPLNGTEGAQSLFWSPDSRWIAFGLGQQLKKIDISGAPPQTLCESTTVVGSGSWGTNGVILFGGRGTGPVQQVSESGGAASVVTKLGKASFHSFPAFLPDGRHFLYLSNVADGAGIYVGLVDATPEQQSSQRLIATGFGAVYAPDPEGGPGRILFLRDGTLMAQLFDPSKLQRAGEPVPVAERVGSTNQYANVTASANGVLAYRGGAGNMVQLTWVDRDGKQLGQAGEAGAYVGLAAAPDGTRAAVRLGNDLWLLEFARGVSTRFTFGQGTNQDPVWSPDGNWIVFDSNRGAHFDLYRKAANGASDAELLLKTDQDKFPVSWTRDGRYLLFGSSDPKTRDDLWALPMDGDRKPVPLVRTQFQDGYGAVSPDGRWLAYLSTESGRAELFVRPFAPTSAGAEGGGKWQISNGGASGYTPRWRGDGKELFYRAPSGALMSVEVGGGAVFQSGSPRRLFDAGNTQLISAAADGKRFLTGLTQADGGPQMITLELNWLAGLKK